MILYDKIKVVVWDLDDTLWEGTFSEGHIFLSNDRLSLLNTLTDCGVINTICSKNDYEPVKERLTELGVWDLFVLPSINWEPKGARVKSLLKDLSLRPANALFIDDNISNLKEVQYYNEGIMIATPDDLSDLWDYFRGAEKKDIQHKRLAQYKIIESKHLESRKYNSNIEFLESCDIHIGIYSDTSSQIDRIFELVQRTNQLNFTKIRSSLEELTNDINNPEYSSGYVRVKDRFGDYGIVGFYLFTGQILKHFLFSCRTIGLGIEQYVYHKLGCPSIRIIPEVAISLNSDEVPHWIKEGVLEDKTETVENHDASILFKGPCDMSGLVGYLQMPQGIKTDFTFTNNEGHLIETHNHSCHIQGAYLWSTNEIESLKKDAFFFNSDCINHCDLKHFKIIFLSTLIEGIYGRYMHNETGAIVAFGHYNYPITDSSFWDDYINSNVQNYGFRISREQLEAFSNHFTFIGRTSPADYVSFLKWLRELMPKDSVLCLILGSEIPYDNETDDSYLDRANYHTSLNTEIRRFTNGVDNIRLIEITPHIHSQSDFSNNINHFTPAVYYSLSRDVLDIIKECEPHLSVKTSKSRYLIKQYIQPIVQRLLPQRWYSCVRGLFQGNKR